MDINISDPPLEEVIAKIYETGTSPGLLETMKKYFAIFQTTLVNSLAYPGELIGRSLMILPFMWIFYQLWTVTFAASGSNIINGMTLHNTMWYLMMAETIELSRPRVARTIAENVKDGSIAYLLNKPYDFLIYQFSVSMGETIFRALMTAIFGGAMVWWLAGPPPDFRSLAADIYRCLRRMGAELPGQWHDRAGSLRLGRSGALRVDLPEVCLHLWRPAHSAGLLSAVAAEHRFCTSFSSHVVRPFTFICLS